MKTQTIFRCLAAGLLLASGGACAGAISPLVGVQEIAPYTPLELKLGVDNSGSALRLGAAVLYNDGSENVIDLYNFSADANGVMIDNSIMGVASGDVFALGELCLQNGYFVAPYIDNFDVRALRWDDMQAMDAAVDTTATNHTTTDCVDLGAGMAGITSLNFDAGEIDFYGSADSGASWNLEASYSVGGDSIIGPFSGGFRPKSGAAPLPLGGTGLGITYQLASGPLHSVLLDPDDGSTVGGPLNWDSFGSHSSFVNNGSLKEIGGLAVPSFSYAFGAANGGSGIGFSDLDLSDGSQSFRMLNAVMTNELSFQGLALEPTATIDDLFVHIFSNRHIRVRYDLMDDTKTFEEIPDYPFEDNGGPVDVAAGEGRLFVGGVGFLGGFRGQGTPGFQIATMNPDPAVMLGEPLGTGTGTGGNGGTNLPVPTLDRLGLLLLLALFVSLAWLRLRTTS